MRLKLHRTPPHTHMASTPALVPALSLTMLVSWGSLYYAFALLAKPMQADLHSSAALTMGAYSCGLVAWGVCAYPAGRLMERIGGRCAMTLGSCLCGGLFAAWSLVQSPGALYLVWIGLGAGMALTLYEPAFAVLVAADPSAYRRRMSIVALAGGMASTVFWPLTQLLSDAFGWRATLLAYSAMHLLVCAPLHWFALPAAALHLGAILTLGLAARQLVALGQIDYAGPVVAVQRRLAELRVVRARSNRWLLFSAPLLWALLIVVVPHGLVGLDVYRSFGLPWVVANLVFGLAILGAAAWVSRRFPAASQKSVFLRWLGDDLTGRRVAVASEFLDDIMAFEAEG